MADIVSRFAPSPNGPLHLGHAYAAIRAHDHARAKGGRFTLRIEDIDGARSRPEHVDALLRDLEWLGIEWDGAPVFQSHRLDSYAAAADALRDRDLIFPCFCTRAQLAGHARYPGTCASLPKAERARRMADEPHSWRLDAGAALRETGPLGWTDDRLGAQSVSREVVDDVVIVPKQAPSSYHLAVTVDDARDKVSDVVRGLDLFEATHVHRLLQALLDLPTPRYFHHDLIGDSMGGKLSKSRKSASLAVLRDDGVDGNALKTRLASRILPAGLRWLTPERIP